jgi:hypothetical protein
MCFAVLCCACAADVPDLHEKIDAVNAFLKGQ